jgi:hypothetical protein
MTVSNRLPAAAALLVQSQPRPLGLLRCISDAHPSANASGSAVSAETNCPVQWCRSLETLPIPALLPGEL